MSIHEFIKDSRYSNIKADILHISPPCQYFSPAHTRNAAHDDENIFALFSCCELVKKTKPRLITLEQTFGMVHERHSIYFNALLNDFTRLGYSVRWKIVKLCTWGLPQDRKRLIIIAAGPGEALPPFPEATHGGNRRSFVKIHDCLKSVEVSDELHNLHSVKYHHPPRRRLDANQLSPTITTGGVASHHPSGLRDYTLREYANLQGFPANHQFKGTRTAIKRQIGNAFAPKTVKVLYKHLHNWLLRVDGTREAYVNSITDLTTLSGSMFTRSMIRIQDRTSVYLSPDPSDVIDPDESCPPTPTPTRTSTAVRTGSGVVDLTSL